MADEGRQVLPPIRLWDWLNTWRSCNIVTVALVTPLAKGNKIVTTTLAFLAKYLLENQEIWKDITEFKAAQPITPWFKVVIHKLLTNHSLEVLKEEIKIFNKGLKVVGNPF